MTRTATLSIVFLVLTWSPVHAADPPPYLFQWGNEGSGQGQFSNPHGISIAANAFVYVADVSNARIQQFTADGVFVRTWGEAGSGDGQFNLPFGLATDLSSNVYVVDALNYRVQKFTAVGEYLLKWGSYGIGDGRFENPFGIAVDDQNYVYVVGAAAGGSHPESHRVQKFTSEGDFVLKWGTRGSGDGQFEQPYGVAADRTGFIYVVELGNARVQKFMADSTFVLKWGGPGTGDGEFNNPKSVAVDDSGYVYVVDSENHRIQKFTGDGTFITKWGVFGSGNGEFRYPQFSAIDRYGNVYVTDAGNHRVQVFGEVFPPVTGACCESDGTCRLTAEDECLIPDHWQGMGTDCDPNPCLSGACCLVYYCLVCSQSECTIYGGLYQGNGTLCVPNPCPTASINDESRLAASVSLTVKSNPVQGDGGFVLSLPSRQVVTLEVLDVAGRVVATPYRNQVLGQGTHQLTYSPANTSGMFFLRLTTGEQQVTTKFLVVQ